MVQRQAGKYMTYKVLKGKRYNEILWLRNFAVKDPGGDCIISGLILMEVFVRR